jgi:hypothetical protein
LFALSLDICSIIADVAGMRRAANVSARGFLFPPFRSAGHACRSTNATLKGTPYAGIVRRIDTSKPENTIHEIPARE